MQPLKSEYQFSQLSPAVVPQEDLRKIENSEETWHVASNPPEANDSLADHLTRFHGQFADCMEMYAPAQIVATYLNAHQEWFCRCAQPMKVEPVGDNGYALAIGRFGAFGYEVEPKVGLELLPPNQGIYRIKTIPVPDYTPPGYEVDFQSAMQLVETPVETLHPKSLPVPDRYSGEITRVEWQLDLSVYVHFPKFILRLPKSLVQNTGDRLLHQIVRKVSRRLTHKVQEDFHRSLGLPIPRK